VEPSPGDSKPHLPPPTVWPVGFAVGVAVVLVGLIVNPLVVSLIGAAIAVVFGMLWVRDLSSGMREHEPPAPPQRSAAEAAAEEAEPEGAERYPRSRFLEGATLGLGAVIGGIVTVPPVALLVASAIEGQKFHDIDLGPLSDFPSGKFVITTFVEDPKAGEVSRRTAYIRYNGLLRDQPSFTILSNRCAHLGCPVQPNGPVEDKPTRLVTDKAGIELLKLTAAQPAGFGCPCHGGQYDTEGNRTAGPPVRALDRYSFDIRNGHVILLSTFSVSHVDGTGAQARIHKYKLAGPGEHVDGPEQWFYPLQPPHH
jgi:quinol---cytochrome c reductase iron-sulfur subunit, bacillus type